MHYNFTERSRRVIALGREEAIALQHDYVGTVHILLGLLRDGEGVAVAALENMNVDLEQVRRRIEKSIAMGEVPVTLGELPYTSRAKNVLEHAIAESEHLKHTYIGTEHLLLGLLREEAGIAAKVLSRFGVTLEAARSEIVGILGPS